MTNLYQKQRIQRHLSAKEKRAKKKEPDLILSVGGYEKECHTLIVSKASPVLEALCRWENGHNIVTIDFNTPFEAADLVIDYIYGYKRAIPESILPNVLKLSKFLLIEELADFCISQFKENDLCVTSCLKTLFMCSLYDIKFEKLIHFIRGNLIELLYKQDMLYIDETSLRYLLCDETLTYLPRYEWLKFVVKWCKFATERKVLFPDLLKFVDLNKIRRSYLQNILQNEDLLEELPQCKEYYDQAIVKEDSERAATMILINSIDNTFVLDIHTGSIYKLFLKNIYQFQNTLFCNGFELGYADMAHMKVYTGRMPIYPDADNRISMEIQWCDDETESLPHILQCLKNDEVFVFLGTKRVKTKPKNKRRFKIFETAEIYILHEQNVGVLQANPFLSFRFDLTVKAVLIDNRLYLFRIYANKYYVHLISLLNCRMITQEISSYFQKFHLNFDICLGNNEDILLTTDKMKIILTAGSLGIKSVEYFSKPPGVKFHIDKGLYSFSTYKRRIEYVNHSEEICGFADIPVTEIRNSSYLHVVMPITMDQTGSLCHVKCPHCDPDIEERIISMEEDERERERMDELERERVRQQFEYSDDDDFYTEDYDDYDDYDDYGFNRIEYIWDGSADEFVEAWW